MNIRLNQLLATLLKSIVMRNHRSVFSAKKLIFDPVARTGGCRETGGAEENRTPDLLRARQALSQLSYGPFVWLSQNPRTGAVLVGLGGLEPPTSPLSGVRSDQLSYRPELTKGFHPSGPSPDRSMLFTTGQIICCGRWHGADVSIRR